MLETHIRHLRAAEAKKAAAINAAIEREKHYSLVEALNARMRMPARLIDSRAAEAACAVDRAVREAGGQPANGFWVPLGLLAQRDLTASASALVVNKLATNIEDMLRPVSILVGAGATVITGVQAGKLLLPAIDSGLDVMGNWTSSEGSTYAQDEPTFRQIAIEPHTLAVELRVSRRLFMNTAGDLEAALRRDLLAGFMQEIDRVGLIGTAANHQPEGLLVRSDIPVIAGGANGAAPTWQHVCEMEYNVTSANGRIERGAWLTNPDVVRKWRVTPRGSGLDYIYPDRRVLGYDVRVSTLVPNNLDKGTSTGVCSAILHGDFAELVIAFWDAAAVDILVDDYTLAHQGLVKIVARADVGIAPRNPGSFAVMKDVLTV